MLVRVRTKDGTERLQLPGGGATLADLRALIASQLRVPLEQQARRASRRTRAPLTTLCVRRSCSRARSKQALCHARMRPS